MQLTDLSPTQLARLADRAQGELERRQSRKPLAEVREQLARAAADEGYALSDVFPEFHAAGTDVVTRDPDTHDPLTPDPITPAPSTRRPIQNAAQMPLPIEPQAPAAASPAIAAPPPTSPAKAAEKSSPDDPARIVVRAAVKASARRPGMPIALDQVRDSAGMQSDWSAFHAALEQAVKRGWLYFSGNDACLLTADGETAGA